MSGFVAFPSDGVRATFTAEEAALLSGFALQVANLIDNREGPGTDPAIDRLLPDGYRDNEEYAVEFRRFTEEELANGKVANALAISEALSNGEPGHAVAIELDARAADSWLRALTDIRLALSVRLGIESESTPPDEEHELLFAVYDWLGYLQDTLVSAIDV